MPKYKIKVMTPGEYKMAYCNGKPYADDIEMRRDRDGFYFVSKGGAYFTESDIYVPDYILNQPWSYALAEVEAMEEDEQANVYVRIVGDKARLYEMPE